LPVDGLTDHLATTVVAREDGWIIGSAALEMYGEHALLRSVAVSPAFQSRGIKTVPLQPETGASRSRGTLQPNPALRHQHVVDAPFLAGLLDSVRACSCRVD
jgi:hypothetical protein